MKYLILRISTFKFAIILSDVLSVNTKESIKQKKNSFGLNNFILRGDDAYPIFDVSDRFQLKSMCNNIIIIKVPSKRNIHFEDVTLQLPCGIFIDEVTDMIDVKEGDISKAGGIFNKANMEGVIYFKDDLIPIIKLETLFEDSTKELLYSVHEEIQKQVLEDKKIKINTLEGSFTHIFKKNEIEEIWKRKHSQ